MFEALRTDAGAEVGFGVGIEVTLDTLPVTGIVAYALAMCADRQQAMQRLDIGERISQHGGSVAHLHLIDYLTGESL